MEDNPPDVLLIKEALRSAGIDADLQVLVNGQDATDFIDRTDAQVNTRVPDIIILDLNLPRHTGIEVLMHLRLSERCHDAPVVITTSSQDQSDKSQTAMLGAEAYFTKPSDYQSFMKLGRIIKELLPN